MCRSSSACFFDPNQPPPPRCIAPSAFGRACLEHARVVGSNHLGKAQPVRVALKKKFITVRSSSHDLTARHQHHPLRFSYHIHPFKTSTPALHTHPPLERQHLLSICTAFANSNCRSRPDLTQANSTPRRDLARIIIVFSLRSLRTSRRFISFRRHPTPVEVCAAHFTQHHPRSHVPSYLTNHHEHRYHTTIPGGPLVTSLGEKRQELGALANIQKVITVA